VVVRAEQKMTDLVRYGATQNYGELNLDVVTPRKTQGIFIVDTGEGRMDGKSEVSVLGRILGGAGKYPKRYVDRFESLAAQPLRVGGGVPVKAGDACE
jgi:hypothetical protein